MTSASSCWRKKSAEEISSNGISIRNSSEQWAANHQAAAASYSAKMAELKAANGLPLSAAISGVSADRQQRQHPSANGSPQRREINEETGVRRSSGHEKPAAKAAKLAAISAAACSSGQRAKLNDEINISSGSETQWHGEKQAAKQQQYLMKSWQRK